ncbi:hypothetical protein B842_06405 [Corynebacterium humireducens NBRC 106098 = DSM 45392]|uniref:Polyhydroxybutyrate depolymerase n=2 Tax=Corynebacterium humireducens TaxID=1223514 RepID=A0A0B5D2K7_9CORY|nr:hypothetical protein B842_06405 [Corynebacterium humireducens NBRC 106098 = DSM 45392]
MDEGAGMRLLILLLSALLLVGCTAEGEGAVPPTSRSVGAPQKTVTGTLTVDGRERTYRVSTPEGFHRGRQWPVVYAFHGWGETAESMEQTTKLDSARAIVVYPQGVANAWAPAPYAETSGEEDIGFVRTLVHTIAEDYPVDRSRIFATGFSNGGGFAAYLSCQLPTTFHAVAPVGAAYYEATHAACAEEPVARLDIHGTHDTVVGYHGGTRHGERYESVPDVLEGVARRNGCERSTMTRNGQTVIAQHWQGCALPLVHLRVGGGDHTWPTLATKEIRSFFGV